MEHGYLTMGIFMIVSGVLSSMSIFANKITDVQFSMNDAYMIGLMTFWMLFFMAFSNRNWSYTVLFSIGIIVLYYFIRKQSFVTKREYFRGMIPHHSMALLTSNRVLENDKNLTEEEKEFISNIISTQEKEIEYMKTKI